MRVDEKRKAFKAILEKHGITQEEFSSGPITQEALNVYREYKSLSYLTSDVLSNVEALGTTRARLERMNSLKRPAPRRSSSD